jgi:hypothetical protein
MTRRDCSAEKCEKKKVKMMKSGLPKKEGKMRIRAFPVSF